MQTLDCFTVERFFKQRVFPREALLTQRSRSSLYSPTPGLRPHMQIQPRWASLGTLTSEAATESLPPRARRANSASPSPFCSPSPAGPGGTTFAHPPLLLLSCSSPHPRLPSPSALGRQTSEASLEAAIGPEYVNNQRKDPLKEELHVCTRAACLWGRQCLEESSYVRKWMCMILSHERN